MPKPNNQKTQKKCSQPQGKKQENWAKWSNERKNGNKTSSQTSWLSWMWQWTKKGRIFVCNTHSTTQWELYRMILHPHFHSKVMRPAFLTPIQFVFCLALTSVSQTIYLRKTMGLEKCWSLMKKKVKWRVVEGRRKNTWTCETTMENYSLKSC